MFKQLLPAAAAGAALALFTATAAFAEKDTSPMPQTKGMQGMDPAQHDKPAKEPYEGCVPNPDKAAQQQKHPMPETKGMKGMDPKAHTVDCPAGYVPKDDGKAKHEHKAPGN